MNLPNLLAQAPQILGTQALGDLPRSEKLLGLLATQDPGAFWLNPLKHAIRSAIASGMPVDTIILLLLLPLVATIIAAARHIVGVRGFGIFLPAALSVVFVATGPVLGLGLFLVIVLFATATRIILKKLKIKLQYLPRMALILWFVVLGVLSVLFSAPLLPDLELANVSIFAILFLVLLAEDFTRVQIGKSAATAVTMTTETLILALVSFSFLTLEPIQTFAILRPETLLLSVLLANLLLGRYVGLRFLEIWRFRRLISG